MESGVTASTYRLTFLHKVTSNFCSSRVEVSDAKNKRSDYAVSDEEVGQCKKKENRQPKSETLPVLVHLLQLDFDFFRNYTLFFDCNFCFPFHKTESRSRSGVRGQDAGQISIAIVPQVKNEKSEFLR
jgi:hypothetical protein